MTNSTKKTSPAFTVANKSILLSIQVPVEYGNIKATEVLQLAIWENEFGDLQSELDAMETAEISYMGAPINYDTYKKQREFLTSIQVDIEAEFDKQVAAVLTQKVIAQLVKDAKF